MFQKPTIPLAPEGWPFVGFTLLLAIGLMPVAWWLVFPLGLVAGFMIWFFRDPERSYQGGTLDVVSPADGTVLDVAEVQEDLYLGDKAVKVSIFMSIVDVHVNRAPVAGKVLTMAYHPGKFLSANLDKASLENERNVVLMEGPNQTKVMFAQIAGLVARRIVPYIQDGQELERGQRVGIIRFGSRMEVFLPLGSEVLVRKGRKVEAGKTLLAKLPQGPESAD